MKKVLLISIFLMISLLLCACSGSKNEVTPVSNTPDRVNQAEQDDESTDQPSGGETEEPIEEEPTEEEPVEEEPVGLQIGETSTLGDWEITLDSFEITSKVDADYGSFSPDEGNQYVVADVTVKNTGKSSNSFLPSFSMGDNVKAKILYQGEYEFSASNLLGHSSDLHDKSLNPLTSKTGIIAFSVVQEAIDSDDALLLVFSAGRETVTYLLR